VKKKPNPQKDRRAFYARRFLQIAVAVFSLVPILAGLAGIFLGPKMVSGSDALNLDLDSHYRYLSGLLTGIGLAFLTCVPRIESKTVPFQVLASIVILGGCGRLYSLIVAGIPNEGMLFGLGMELFVTPLLALCQLRTARQAEEKA
jgi:hypothetical protein